MKSKNYKYIFSLLLLAVASMMVSCHDDKLPLDTGTEESGDGELDGDVLVVRMSLDRMGGDDENDPYAKIESYVNPEKIRVFVFDSDDKFLFESKNRYIKQLDPADDHSVWSVSIPLASYGNDESEDWEWDKIREKLTTGKFKIAIFANRPDREWNMGVKQREHQKDKEGNDIEDKFQDVTVPDDLDLSDRKEVLKYYVDPGPGWFGSVGPYWDKTNSSVSYIDEKEIKDVFDIHHCQYDPIYHGKNVYTTGRTFNEYGADNYNFYGCITEDDSQGDNPWMCATSSWVDWGENDRKEDHDEDDFRYTKIPSEEYPIPMYGIQEFKPLTEWKKGSTINLNRMEKDSEGNVTYQDKAISLLRSVVKLELLLPKNYTKNNKQFNITDVYLFYPNIYARVEPMDVWTPTDQIWTADIDHFEKCEWNLIKYNRMAQDESTLNGTTKPLVIQSRSAIQKRLAWLYGIWKIDKGWSFETNNICKQGTGDNIDNYIQQELNTKYGTDDKEQLKNLAKNDFVRIFNPCIQRNTTIHVKKCEKGCLSHASYDHYVAYVGERNINDPTNLGQIGTTGAGDPTVMYWTLLTDDVQEGTANGTTYQYYTTYSFPIAQYDKMDTPSNIIYKGFKMSNQKVGNGADTSPGSNNSSSSTGFGIYAKNLQQGENSLAKEYWPLPLLRNHVYKITLTGGNAKTRSNGEIDFSVQFEEKHTKDIGFE